jgi:hypothetical protein
LLAAISSFSISSLAFFIEFNSFGVFTSAKI